MALKKIKAHARKGTRGVKAHIKKGSLVGKIKGVGGLKHPGKDKLGGSGQTKRS